MKLNLNRDLMLIVVLSIALVAGVVYMGANKNILNRAYFASATMQILPSDKITGNVGDTLTAKLFVTTGNVNGAGALLQNVRSFICFGSHITLADDQIAANTTNGFNTTVYVTKETRDGNNCAMITFVSDKNTELKSGAVEIATLKFNAVSAGDGSILIGKAESKLAGINSALDKAMEISSTTGTTYTINQPIGPQLKFKTSFKFLVNNAECMVPSDWPVTVTVMGQGVTKVYTGVVLTKNGVENGMPIYHGQVPMGDFANKSNISVFIKGSKHLMNKYGRDGQTDFYNQFEGQLTLNDANHEYDFSKFPMLPGDVVSRDGETQDGVVDGLDYSYVKTKMVEIQRTTAGHNLRADLDGNCIVNSLDVSYLLYTLSARQEQLY